MAEGLWSGISGACMQGCPFDTGIDVCIGFRFPVNMLVDWGPFSWGL